MKTIKQGSMKGWLMGGENQKFNWMVRKSLIEDVTILVEA